ncbi:NAD(P)-dependent oxidoreductase [Porticoccaceae bacterium]|nr:oxidoreductase [Porticoccaceae bacterium]MDC1144827.1 NAD(P)-dependent oxidoreductase [Porticoccaceae bacterium]MDG2115175.1 NAD(P)-dependent oxidoreductase [Porticoccaceae bacterium]
MKAKLAFIGLGVMGYPMAGWLSRNGHQVTVYNRTNTVAERWIADFTGQLALSPATAVENADIVFVCVGNDNDVSEVMLGEQGIITAMASGAIIVDHTTTSAKLARQLAIKVQRTGNQFIDAPVSGGQQGAENGQLTVMCGGQAESFAKVKPIIECYAKSVQLMGDSGSGQLCKMVNQICIAGLLQGLAEGLNFAERAGLDAHQVIDVISQGAAQSWQMENRYKTMLAGDYEHGFAVQWMRKDLAFALQEARSNGAQLPVTELVDQYYEQIEGMGGGRYDTSSLLFRLKHPDQA